MTRPRDFQSRTLSHSVTSPRPLTIAALHRSNCGDSCPEDGRRGTRFDGSAALGDSAGAGAPGSRFLKIKSMAVDGTWNVYLSGEIHSDWRQRIADGVRDAGLPVELLAPVTDHAASDDVGADILGEEDEQFWRDHKGAGVNAVRTQTLLRRADVVVVRFGDKYRQWNAAFEAGYAAALGKPIDHPSRRRPHPRAQGGRPGGDGRRRDARAGGRGASLRGLALRWPRTPANRVQPSRRRPTGRTASSRAAG